MIYLGNLLIEQIEREYCVLFSEEDKKWLLEHQIGLKKNTEYCLKKN